VLAFPGTFINAFHGQNGFLTTALFGGAILTLQSRPALAGVLFGLLSFKPQLGLLIPLALACARLWTAFVVAAATSIAFAAVSALVIGAGSWLAFWNNLPVVRMVLDDGSLPWAKIPSLYIFLRTLGAAAAPAYALHAALAVAVAAVVAQIWWRDRNSLLAAAVLTSGAVLVPPYLFDYDLALLAIPLAILAWDGVQRGWLPWEREVLVAAWLLPLVGPGFTEATGVPVAAPCLLALFAVAVRRAAHRTRRN
jgi:Glycosyltransferase family 87